MDNVVGMQKLKVWPIFRVSNAGEEKWISPGVENSEDRDFAGHLVMSGAQGVSIEWKWNSPKIGKDVDEKAVSQMPRDAKPQAAGQNLMLDAVVLHEGVIDTLPSSIWPSKDEEVQEAPEAKLLGLAPRVLRSSGRGSLARRLSSALPFIEFSEISETVYRSRNKPALGKAICSVSGFCPAENGRGEA
ncbi:MAG: hypothetical protein KDL10_10255, partial [Kiritimatiellae bacterium]|nr:hypothetical protein [Kiritimatiellia bacterium]